MSHEEAGDIMDSLANLDPGSPLAELRAERSEARDRIQKSDAALFSPQDDGGLSREMRFSAALRISRLIGDATLEAHYQSRLTEVLGAGAGVEISNEDPRWPIVASHVDCVIRSPHSAGKADIDALLANGVSPHALVSLSQLIAYVSFQSRLLAGLRMMRDSK